MTAKFKKALPAALFLLAAAAAAALGCTVFRSRAYAFLAAAIALLACAPFALHFERSAPSAMRLALIAMLTALSVVGRILFAPLQSFKPVAAITILTALYFGPEAGFLTGALSALISNFYFGQGMWTPFQMFAWGVIGLIAGWAAPRLKKSLPALCAFGAAAGLLYSLILDVYSALWFDNAFDLARYFALVASSAPVTLIYAVSNVFFLLLLARPVGKKIQRIIEKYGL